MQTRDVCPKGVQQSRKVGKARCRGWSVLRSVRTTPAFPLECAGRGLHDVSQIKVEGQGCGAAGA